MQEQAKILNSEDPAILLTGSHGLLGTALQPMLLKEGFKTIPLVRNAPGSPATWDTRQQQMEIAHNLDLHAVIHLAGENIASGYWNAARMQRIRDSRVAGTMALVSALRKMTNPPKVLLSASAVGIYGSRADEILDEKSSAGQGFLADLAREWEANACKASEFGMRVIILRFGIIISPEGGALKKMLPPFRLGLGGMLGSGEQWISWLGLSDTVRAILFLLKSTNAEGAYNIVSPSALTNATFARTLARSLRRPAFCTVPKFALRLLFGKMADETLLASQRCIPARLLQAGFTFSRDTLEKELASTLG